MRLRAPNVRLRPPNYQQRSRRRFVFVVIAIALFAVLAGALLAYLILVDGPKKRPVAMGPPPPPKPVEQFRDAPIQAWDPEPTPELPERPKPRAGKPRPETLDDDSIRSALSRLQDNFNQCARQYGAVDGSLVRVGFSASAEGQVTGVFALAPHAKTPLGRCIVDAVARVKLRKTELGRADIRWSIILHP
jgi:hypothetical protein